MDNYHISNLIRDTRLRTFFLLISIAEVEFVLKSKVIDATAKIIWLNFAMRSVFDYFYSCTFSYAQIAEMTGETQFTVYCAIQNLKTNRFLREYGEWNTDDMPNTYYLSLPPDGLEALRNAPSRGPDSFVHPRDYPYHPGYKKRGEED